MLRRTSNLTATFLFVFLLTAASAYAGPFTGLLSYVQNNIVGDIEVLAIIGIGILLFSHHVPWWAVIGICGGIYIMSNATSIVSSISNAG